MVAPLSAASKSGFLALMSQQSHLSILLGPTTHAGGVWCNLGTGCTGQLVVPLNWVSGDCSQLVMHMYTERMT